MALNPTTAIVINDLNEIGINQALPTTGYALSVNGDTNITGKLNITSNFVAGVGNFTQINNNIG